MIPVGKVLWQPSEAWIRRSNLHAFREWLVQQHGQRFESLAELRQWSIRDIDAFWQAIWDYFNVEATQPARAVLGKRTMPGAEWFPGARVNYAYHILRNEKPGALALLHASERRPLRELGWPELGSAVRRVATQLRNAGVAPGDRVACYLPNTPEAVTVLLASASIGAVCAACAPEFGTRSVLDRLTQIEPKVLFCVDGYYYKGKFFDMSAKVAAIVEALPSLEQIVQLPYADEADRPQPLPGATTWHEYLDIPEVPKETFQFEDVDFSHPLWILFSSGTTGLPKAIVHSHGGMTLEQFKLSALHYDLKPDDRIFFFTTTGWMMWNYIVSSLIVEARPLLYDGNPTWPEMDFLWSLADAARVRMFGASPTLQQLQERAGIVPKNKYRLEKLELIMLAGSPVSAECTNWFYENVKQDLYVAPGSGGTDICSGFCGPMPGLPVKAGVIQMPHLGVDLQVFDDDGNSLRNTVGEFVVTQPMPSMPIYMWNDEGNEKYLDSYFDVYPGVWRQGDYLMIDDDEGCYVLGRSDATLNRYGVRIGTAEIYRSLDALDEVEDSLIVNIELPNGGFFMPLFVKLPQGTTLNEAIEKKICETLKRDYSPRHVPDRIYQVDDIPYTLTGKKMEVPVRKILLGVDERKAANRGAMSNPAALDFFVRFQREQKEYSLAK